MSLYYLKLTQLLAGYVGLILCLVGVLFGDFVGFLFICLGGFICLFFCEVFSLLLFFFSKIQSDIPG